ncbi:MAG: acyl carrier protein [Ruminococcaceae bacterium]|nr:acyl carrier protein [Oscillospiraceae bacterium]
MKEQILDILEGIHPEIDYETEESLITDGLLDSFAIVSIINALNEEFGIEVTIGELRPENLNSVDNMVALVERLMD